MSSARASTEKPALIRRPLALERVSFLKGMSCGRLRVILGSEAFMGCFSVKDWSETLSRPSVPSPHPFRPLTLRRLGQAGDEGIDVTVDRLGSGRRTAPA